MHRQKTKMREWPAIVKHDLLAKYRGASSSYRIYYYANHIPVRDTERDDIQRFFANTGRTQTETGITRFWTGSLEKLFDPNQLLQIMNKVTTDTKPFFAIAVQDDKIHAMVTGQLNVTKFLNVTGCNESILHHVGHVEYVVKTRHAPLGMCAKIFPSVLSWMFTAISKIGHRVNDPIIVLEDDSPPIASNRNSMCITEKDLLQCDDPDECDNFLRNENANACYAATKCYLLPAIDENRRFLVFWMAGDTSLHNVGSVKKLMVYTLNTAKHEKTLIPMLTPRVPPQIFETIMDGSLCRKDQGETDNPIEKVMNFGNVTRAAAVDALKRANQDVNTAIMSLL